MLTHKKILAFGRILTGTEKYEMDTIIMKYHGR